MFVSLILMGGLICDLLTIFVFKWVNEPKTLWILPVAFIVGMIIAILIILISNTVSVALPLYFATKTLSVIIPIKNNVIIPIIINVSHLIIATFFERYQQFIIAIIHLNLSPVMLCLGNIAPFLLLFIKPKKADFTNKKALLKRSA